MLDLIQLQFLHGPSHIVRGSPLAHMRLQAQALCFCPAINGFEVLNRLRQFVSIQIYRIERLVSPKVRQTVLQVPDGAVPRKADLQPQFRMGRDFFLVRGERSDQFVHVMMKEFPKAPYILLDFQHGDAVVSCLPKGCPNEKSSHFRRVESFPEVFPIPCMHFVHRRQGALDRLYFYAGHLPQVLPAAAQYKMVVQVGFWTSSDFLQISLLQCAYEFVHRLRTPVYRVLYVPVIYLLHMLPAPPDKQAGRAQ